MKTRKQWHAEYLQDRDYDIHKGIGLVYEPFEDWLIKQLNAALEKIEHLEYGGENI